MIFLIFCTYAYVGYNSSMNTTAVCTAPTVMPNERICHFVGNQMEEMARGSQDTRYARHRCLTVK